MPTFLAIVTIIFLLFGAFLVTSNWIAAFVSYRNKRKGIDRYISGTPVVPQICVLIAASAAQWTQAIQVPSWIFWVIALADTTVFMLLYWPIFLILRKRDGQT